MSSFTVPQEFAAFFAQFKERTELLDNAGNLIGTFTPEANCEAPHREDRAARWTPEEAEQLWEASRHLPGRPLAEFWRELKESGKVPE